MFVYLFAKLSRPDLEHLSEWTFDRNVLVPNLYPQLNRNPKAQIRFRENEMTLFFGQLSRNHLDQETLNSLDLLRSSYSSCHNSHATLSNNSCRGIPLSAVRKDTISKFTGLFSYYPLMLNAKLRSYKYQLFKPFGLTLSENQ